MNEAARELVGAAAQRFSEGVFTVEANTRDSEAIPGSVLLVFRHPSRSDHRVEVAQRGNSFVVAYSDGAPPGPAEKLFVYDNPGELRDAVQEVIAFAASVFTGRVVVWRKRLSPVARLLRGRDCDSLLWFSSPDELTPRKRRRLVALYEWSAA